ncbi:Tubulin-specific chaperone D [Wickerhamomyces ciferrii]|uniref:Tubulin-specific chaperone D n=1 Tax=Wickerhamomyces ciferrii (strain ATCC 14091 / BCRC 22168 / CBS 111 / JCM 3599 / NBRC 0793 / NRRL Y-1031 F-60-10) TaxID=1206466 RepID=K0KJL0_WICCF|nr:Tubulin-specific chaperone D [Wickerhamomyces ciferrii]CCH41263.1 Tubulin-specific chaperone D [Wickerhamomyces ciferrii]
MEADEIRVAKIANELHQEITNQIELNSKSQQSNVSSLVNSINQFLPCPQLLDKHLKNYVDSLLALYIDQGDKWTTEVFYTFGKVVSSKKMLNFMKTDISLIPTILSKFTDSYEKHWHEEYLLLCWLSVLCIAPFKLDTLRKDSKEEIFDIGLKYSKNAGPLQPLGSRVLASLIMRSDSEEQFHKFIQLITSNYNKASLTEQFGYLQTLNLALQKDSNMLFKPILPQLTEFLKSNEGNEGSLDMIIKIYSKIVTYLVDIDDYDQIEDIISFFLDNFASKNTETRFLIARKFVKIVKILDTCMGIEIVMDIIESIIELLKESFETINSDKLHTYLLTIAEFLRLSIIDFGDFKEIEHILSKTLFFQQSRITFVAGSNIRDASNFICWSLFKYNKDVDLKIAHSIFLNLLLVACFDKEIMIRRSSTAALQELIGRYGNKIWNEFYPNEENSAKNIKSIEILDYVDLGSIDKSYFDIPSNILKLFPSLKQKFIKFLSSNVYNVDYDLVKLSSKGLKILLGDSTQSEIDEIISEHIETPKSRFNTFIVLSEILPLSKSTSHNQALIPKFQDVKINHHKDLVFVISSYLSLFGTLLSLGYEPLENDFENLFNAIRIEHEDIRKQLVQLASNLSLSPEYWSKWIYYMKNNNKNTAANVGLLPDFNQKSGDVLNLLSSGIDADTRSLIIKSVSQYLVKGGELSKDSLIILIEQLDDYTISEHGDVGNKIRSANIQLINSNIEKFLDQNLRVHVEHRLLRISGEPIDKTRYESFKLLNKFLGKETLETRSLDEYFSNLLEIFKSHYFKEREISVEFWRGYIFSCGALKATDSLIVSTLKTFLKFYSSLNDLDQKEVLLQLASVIKLEPEKLKGTSSKSQRLNKTILVGLQFWSRILEANISIPEIFPLKGLYVRIYNLHLNTNSITRLSTSIKIFGQLSLMGLEESLKRLCWLTVNHPIARARVLASEELFNYYNEKLLTSMDDPLKTKIETSLKIIVDTDWSKDHKLHKVDEILII